MSDDLEMRLAELDNRIARTQTEINACVQQLLTDDEHAHLIAERLPRLGSAALPELQKIMSNSSHTATVRLLAALIGFEVGDRQESLALLIDEVAHNGEFGPLAARRLAEREIPDAERALVTALSSTDDSEVDAVVSYLESLHILGAPLPQVHRERFAASSAWQVTTAIAQWYPP
jgi:hypothetical protein